MKLTFLILLLNSMAYADIVSTDANGQISIQTGKMNDLCINSGSTACGTIKAGVGSSSRVGINNTSPSSALDVTGTVTATAVTAATITGTVTGASSLNVLKTGDTMTGTLTASGASGISVTYGISAASGTFIGGSVSVSTATTSSSSLCLAGSFQTLPTSGYAKGCFAYQLSDNTAYVSTMTVTEAGDWKALY